MKSISLPDKTLEALVGRMDETLRLLEDRFRVRIDPKAGAGKAEMPEGERSRSLAGHRLGQLRCQW